MDNLEKKPVINATIVPIINKQNLNNNLTKLDQKESLLALFNYLRLAVYKGAFDYKTCAEIYTLLAKFERK